MKIAIMGIGGVGGYYGGLLSKHYADNEDVEIVFIARGRHLEEIQARGLQLIHEKGTFTIHPDKATDSPAGCGIFDLILFCVKGYDLEESAKLLDAHIGENTVVITLLNGVDNADRLKSTLRKGKILNGCVYIGAHIVRPGVCQQAGGSCKMFFGSESNDQIDGKSIEKIFRDANIDTEYRKDIRNIVWEKYLFVSPFANATTFLNKTMGEILDCAEGKELIEKLLEEVLSIAKAQGVELPENIKETTIEKAGAFPYETKTSMQMDFEKGRKTELDTLTGYIVWFAKSHGIATPLYDEVYHSLLTPPKTCRF